MARGPRATDKDVIFHVINRGNQRRRIFHKPADARAFVNLIAQLKRTLPIRIYGYCIMSNHWHLVLQPTEHGQLSRFMHRLSTTHVRRYLAHYHDDAGGHLYQGRFKSFPVANDEHLLSVLRYVEANPLRAGLVTRADSYPFSSLWLWHNGRAHTLLDEWPVDRPSDWLEWVNQPVREAELERVRTCIARSRPYGREDWVTRIAKLLGLDQTLRPRGRPRKTPLAAEVINEE